MWDWQGSSTVGREMLGEEALVFLLKCGKLELKVAGEYLVEILDE